MQRKEGRHTRKIINARNALGAVSFLALLTAPGAVEGENYMLSAVLIAIMAICAYLADKEDGKRK